MDYVKKEKTEEELIEHFGTMDDYCLGFAEDTRNFVFFPEKLEPVKFTATGQQTLSMSGLNTSSKTMNYEYSYNGFGWKSWGYEETEVTSAYTGVTFEELPFGDGQSLYIRGKNSGGTGTKATYFSGATFILGNSSSLVDVEGDLYSLVDYDYKNFGDGFSGLSDRCFYRLFYNCSALRSAKDLRMSQIIMPASAFWQTFAYCTSLTDAPVLPTKLSQQYTAGVFYGMFYSCSSLVEAPFISLSYYGDSSCMRMFEKCTSLEITQDNIESSTGSKGLSVYAFEYMFSGCTSLTKAPNFNFTDANKEAFMGTFCGCTSLVTAMENLNITNFTNANDACRGMFYGCVNLEKAPILPATSTYYSGNHERVYEKMFYGCAKLNWVKALFQTDPSRYNFTNDWLYGVASAGTFIKDTYVNWDYMGEDGVPYGWTIKYDKETEYDPDMQFTPAGYVTFTSTTGRSRITLSQVDAEKQTFYISKDGTNWQKVNQGDIFRLEANEYLYMCGKLTSALTNSTYTHFGITGSINMSGNANALWSYDDLSVQVKGYCGYRMFSGSTGLLTSPELPTTSISMYCYYGMFSGCTNLVTAPSILPATALVQHCYDHMFCGCSNLTTAPVLPATKLTAYCYYYMFYGCKKLNYIKAMFTTTPSSTIGTYYTSQWVYGVASSGTFVKNSAATWTTTGANGVPSGWTVERASS